MINIYMHTVKTLGSLQPYFRHLSCIPDVCVGHVTIMNSKQGLNVVVMLLISILLGSSGLQKPMAILVPFPCNQGTQMCMDLGG